MGMFSRMTDIVQANINALLDKAEDPQKMIRLIVQEMEETLVEVRTVAARSLADKKSLQRNIEKFQIKANDWHNKAQLAMEKDREDLARAALVEKHQAQQKVDELASQLAVIEEGISKLQEDTAQLQAKMSEARAKQKSLDVRQQYATVRLQVKSQHHVEKIDQVMVKFDQYERRIDDLEAQVEAFDLVDSASDLASQFAQLEVDEKIEQELEALKNKAA